MNFEWWISFFVTLYFSGRFFFFRARSLFSCPTYRTERESSLSPRIAIIVIDCTYATVKYKKVNWCVAGYTIYEIPAETDALDRSRTDARLENTWLIEVRRSSRLKSSLVRRLTRIAQHRYLLLHWQHHNHRFIHRIINGFINSEKIFC